ncbi:TonB-dependent receptor [Tenacibaculum amylolyticum]|uniref:TonB-dependent receptor n=1 Tax=Tenacibaculum amylolyticum TaxID=104269 RepID=UPI0038960E14
MKHFIAIICLLTVFLGNTQTIKGKVTFNNEPVPFVSVYIKDTSIGTTTNENGLYEINATAQKATIVFQSIGFKIVEKEIQLNTNNTITIDVSLEEDVLGLDQVVVSATRTHLNRKLAPVIVSVTDSKLLDATQSISLSEGLNFQPGLRMETNCQNCGFSQVRINGLDGAYSQILVDSRPIFSALNGVYGLDQIPANVIQRIEVVRGGGSALYGANAIAGTINIITKDPIENTFQVGQNVSLIKGDALDLATTLNGTVVNEEATAGLTYFGMYRNRNPYDYDGDSFTEITKLETQTFGFKGYLKPTETSRLTAEFNSISEFRRGGNKLSLQPFESDVAEQIDSDVLIGGLTYESVINDGKQHFSAYVSTSRSKNKNYYGGGEDLIAQNGTVIGFGNSRDETWVLGSQYAHRLDSFLGGKGNFTGGIEFKYDKMKDEKPGFNAFVNQTLRTYGIYAQQEWTINKQWKVLGGLRADIHNLTDENIILNPRLNVLYFANENTRLRASYAKGFRAPQVFTEDLHAQIAAGEVLTVRVDRANLVSETSHSFTASFDWNKNLSKGEIAFTLEAFYTKLVNPFILEQLNNLIWEKRNGDNADVKGINIEAKYAPNEKWILQAGATIQEGKYNEPVQWSDDPTISLENADNFFKSPNFYGNFVATYAPTKRFQNNISGVYTGSMYVPHLAGFITQDWLEKTQDFFELNLKSSYDFYLDDHKHSTIQISGGIQNLFDSYQQDFDQGADRDANYIYGPSRPRTFFIGLKFFSN